MELADKIIEANKKPKDKKRDYFVDDVGLPVKNNYRKDYRYYTEYLVARIVLLHPKLNKRGDKLFDGYTLITSTAESIAELAQYSEPIPRTMVVNIYRRLKELSPDLNPDIVVVADDVGWDLKEGKFVDLDPDKYKTI